MKSDSLAFPAISCGVYGFPIPRAAGIAVRVFAEVLSGYPELERLLVAAFDAQVEDRFALGDIAQPVRAQKA